MQKYTKNGMNHSKQRSNREYQKSRSFFAPLIFPVILMVMTIFATFSLKVYLCDKTEKMNSEIFEIKNQIELCEKEITNSNAKIARYSSKEYIDTKIQEYNLNLRQTDYQQITKMARNTAPKENSFDSKKYANYHQEFPEINSNSAEKFAMNQY